MKSGKRPPKLQSLLEPQADNDKFVWSVIEDCWSQEPLNRPTAEAVSLRLRDVNGYPVTVKPEFLQPHTNHRQLRHFSINKDSGYSTARRDGSSRRSRPNVPGSLAQLPEIIPNNSNTRCVRTQGEKLLSKFLSVLEVRPSQDPQQGTIHYHHKAQRSTALAQSKMILNLV